MSDGGWESMPDGAKAAVVSMASARPRTAPGDSLASSETEPSQRARCTAAPRSKPRKTGPDAGLPPAYSTCGHKYYGKTAHCGAMACSNYKEKCPKCRIAGGG